MNANRDPNRIENDIEHTREEMSETLDQIQERFSPGRLLDQAMSYFNDGSSGSGADFGQNLLETVKQNPVPTVMVGLGLSWLMLSGKNDGGGRRAAPGGAVQLRRAPAPTVDVAGRDAAPAGVPTGGFRRDDAASGSASSSDDGSIKETVSAKAGAAADGVKQAAAGAKQQASAAVSAVGDHASHQAERVQQGFESMLREQPLVLIGAGLALGAMVGAALPATRREDELMGETRDQLVDQAAAVGSEHLDKAKAVAGSAAEAAAKAAEDQGVTPGAGGDKAQSLKESAQRIAAEAGDAAKQEADRQGLTDTAKKLDPQRSAKS